MDVISVYIPILGSFSKILTTTKQNDDKDGTKLIYQHLEQQWSGKPAKNCPSMVHKISQTLIKPILNTLPQKALGFLQKNTSKQTFLQEISHDSTFSPISYSIIPKNIMSCPKVIGYGP